MNLTIIFITFVMAVVTIILTIIFANRRKAVDNPVVLQELKNEVLKVMTQLESTQQTLKDATEKNEQLQNEKADLARTIGKLETAIANNTADEVERKKAMEAWYNDMQVKFGEIAESLVDKKKDEIEEKSADVLEPLRLSLKDMKEELEKAKDTVKVDLNKELSNLKDMNRKLGEETNHLANVFKGGNNVQGRWGEAQLARVLEIAGIPEGEMGYTMQVSAQNGNSGQDRPDCIVHLPDDKCIIIDAKTNLTAYERSFNASDEEERTKCLKEHAKAVKNQITILASKRYHENKEYNNPGFVIMFSPVESAMASAQQYSEEDLFQYAASKKITIATPWNLIPILLVVRNMWKADQQDKNAKKIAERGTLIYNKVYEVLKTVDTIDKSVATAQKECEHLKTQLGETNGGLIQQARTLEKLGVKPVTTKTGENCIENTETYKTAYDEGAEEALPNLLDKNDDNNK